MNGTRVAVMQRGSLLLLLCVFTARASVLAQHGNRIGGALAIGATPNLAEAFSNDQICPRRAALAASARVTAALTSRFQLEILGERFYGPRADCIDGLIPPPPPSGPFTRTIEYFDDHLTNPPTVLSLRLAVVSMNTAAVAVRPYIGIGRLAGKNITVPQVGLSLFPGIGALRFLAELEGWFYDVPKRHVEEQFLDGRLLQRSATVRDIATFSTIFRFGGAWLLGGR